MEVELRPDIATVTRHTLHTVERNVWDHNMNSNPAMLHVVMEVLMVDGELGLLSLLALIPVVEVYKVGYVSVIALVQPMEDDCAMEMALKHRRVIRQLVLARVPTAQSMAAGDNGQLSNPVRQHVALGHRLDTTIVTRHTRPMVDSIA